MAQWLRHHPNPDGEGSNPAKYWHEYEPEKEYGKPNLVFSVEVTRWYYNKHI
jgi:hypothetical protein